MARVRKTGSSKDFNPRSPCGERQVHKVMLAYRLGFQSTLPVWGATTGFVNSPNVDGFQSTPPASGGATPPWECGHTQEISIHAPRVGSDLLITTDGPNDPEFQSTLPVWGATPRCR